MSVLEEHATKVTDERAAAVELSVVAPVFDEVDNLRPLYERVRDVFGDETSWELVLVDDGSTDGSAGRIRDLGLQDARVRGAFLAHNCGQTSALSVGFRHSRGVLIATLDADLQNDPADLPMMIDALEGHDAVVGYRATRNDNFVRRASSRIANSVRNRLSGDSIRDTGCSLKVFKSEALKSIPLFEGMHRFLPTLLRFHGFDVIEVAVSHHPRVHGRSKYGVWNRVFRATRDLFAVRWMRSRIIRAPESDGPG